LQRPPAPQRKVQLRPLVGPIAINKNLIWHLRFTGTSIKDFPLNQHPAQGAKQSTSCNLLVATGLSRKDFSRLLQGVLKNYCFLRVKKLFCQFFDIEVEKSSF
jgi:hypothetical protein